jgi:hypothetical protein
MSPLDTVDIEVVAIQGEDIAQSQRLGRDD